jgi:hypothetical protein
LHWELINRPTYSILHCKDNYCCKKSELRFQVTVVQAWTLLDGKCIIYCKLYLKMYTIMWKICIWNVKHHENQFLLSFMFIKTQHNVIQIIVSSYWSSKLLRECLWTEINREVSMVLIFMKQKDQSSLIYLFLQNYTKSAKHIHNWWPRNMLSHSHAVWFVIFMAKK